MSLVSPAQQRLDRARATSAQRVVLAVVAIVSPVVACVCIGSVSHHATAVVAVLIGIVALGSTVRPDTHVGSLVVVGVVWYWLACIDDTASPWSLLVAAALFAFHTSTALIATVPNSATVDGETLGRWLRRSTIVMAATVAVWLLVVLLSHRHAAGSPALSLVALVALVAVALSLRRRSTARD
ncbi:MAG: hypothetical protein JWM34_2738 [Ilumatobacteraceae bacterium]|nr:hypothetical protein [Ilumatobacteraceae bacterium]